MTEAEWLACRDPDAMFGFLLSSYRPLSARKLRLFATYCCRNVLHPDREPELHRAVDIAERYAEGNASEMEFHAVFGPVGDLAQADFGTDYVVNSVWILTRYAADHPSESLIPFGS